MRNPQPLAFSLIEIIVVIGIMAVLTTISLAGFKSFQNRNLLNNTAQAIAQILAQAEISARAGEHDSNRGVFFQTRTATGYSGNNYQTRDPAFDSPFPFPDIVSGAEEIDVNFQKLTGFPPAAAAIIINSNNGDTKTITINEKGVIDY